MKRLHYSISFIVLTFSGLMINAYADLNVRNSRSASGICNKISDIIAIESGVIGLDAIFYAIGASLLKDQIVMSATTKGNGSTNSLILFLSAGSFKYGMPVSVFYAHPLFADSKANG